VASCRYVSTAGIGTVTTKVRTAAIQTKLWAAFPRKPSWSAQPTQRWNRANPLLEIDTLLDRRSEDTRKAGCAVA